MKREIWREVYYGEDKHGISGDAIGIPSGKGWGSSVREYDI